MNLLIPKKMWFVKRSLEVDALAYMCQVDGSVKAFERRKNTGISWAGARDVIDSSSDEFDNELVDGFKIVGQSTRYSTSNQVWRVWDPRGFTVEIYCDNLLYLIQDGEIVNGEIEGACCWSRTPSGQNFLLMSGTSLYEEALKYTQEKAKPASYIPLKTIDVGDTVRIKGGYTDLIYLGKKTPIEIKISCTMNHTSDKWNIVDYKRPPLCFFNKNTKSITYLSSNTIVFHAPNYESLPSNFIHDVNQAVLDNIWDKYEGEEIHYTTICLVLDDESKTINEIEYGYIFKIVQDDQGNGYWNSRYRPIHMTIEKWEGGTNE